MLTVNSTAAESSVTAFSYFDADTGIVSGGTASNMTNQCAWMFRRTAGFFDIVTYTGTGTARTVPHSLGVAPQMIWVKNRATARWRVYNSVNGATGSMSLNEDFEFVDADQYFNDTEPTSSVFTVATNTGVNADTKSYVAYLFATLSGVSKVGSYPGTGNNVDVDCGFSSGARLVIIKRTDVAGDWYIWDTARGISTGDDPYLLLNDSAVEDTDEDYIDPLNSGFTVTSTAPAALNASGGTYLFLAIA